MCGCGWSPVHQHIVSRGSDPPLIQGSALCPGSHTLCARTRDRWIKCFKNNQQDFFNKGSILSTLNVMRVFVSLNQKISWKRKQRFIRPQSFYLLSHPLIVYLHFFFHKMLCVHVYNVHALSVYLFQELFWRKY